jgi:hypothetical protein
MSAVFSPDDMKKFNDGSDPLLHPNTDWYGSVIRKWSPQQRHNLQLTGGSENINTWHLWVTSTRKVTTKTPATGYKQYDMRINLDTKINKYVTANLGCYIA